MSSWRPSTRWGRMGEIKDIVDAVLFLETPRS